MFCSTTMIDLEDFVLSTPTEDEALKKESVQYFIKLSLQCSRRVHQKVHQKAVKG